MKLDTAQTKLSKKGRRADAREREVQQRHKAEKRAADKSLEKKRRRRRRVITVTVWIVVIALVAAGGYYFVDRGNKLEAQGRAEMTNTKIVFESEPDVELLRRVDGSYYSVSTDEKNITTYRFTSVDNDGLVVEKTATTSVPATPGFWMTSYDEVDITVHVIDADETDPQPRVETQRCVVKPIDPSKPSYTGDPHGASSYEPGTGKSLREDPWGDIPPQLCKDRIMIWVPDGTVQP